MAGIPPGLYRDLRILLLRCGPFDSNSELRALFVDERLAPWRSRVPEASSARSRAQAVIATLVDAANVKGENALVLLILVLRDDHDPGTACYKELDALARELAEALGSPLPETSEGDATTRGAEIRPSSRASDATPTEIRNRYALLIGVRDYVDPNYRSLPHTVPDVVELAEVLGTAGYTVRLLHSDQMDPMLKPTMANIWGELGNLAKSTGPGDLLLVYFGGHGIADDGKAYLLPGDARQGSLLYTAIDLDKFKQTLTGSGAQTRILFLDACHSGIGRDAAGMAEAFARHVYLTAEGTATLAACRQHEVAHEHHETPHGAFTHFILEGLRGAVEADGFVTFNALADYVTASVRQWAIERGLQQAPNAESKIVGNPALVIR